MEIASNQTKQYHMTTLHPITWYKLQSKEEHMYNAIADNIVQL